MSPNLQFLLACLGISLILTYALWCQVRPWILRQQLFAIRDDLWDAMRATGQLDHHDHRELRELINALIGVAGMLTWPTFLFLLITRGDFRLVVAPPSEIPEVNRTRLAVARCVAGYLLRATLTGRVFLAWAWVFGFTVPLWRFLARIVVLLLDTRAFLGPQESLAHGTA